MSGGICKDMNGAKCAENYCDYWDAEKQRCSIAIRESEMAKYYESLNKQNAKAKDLSEQVMESVNFLKDAITKGSTTIQ